jgi:hypothetical protein
MILIRRHLLRPQGQALLATLLFCFVFTILFATLYKVGWMYHDKIRATRGADLTVLSGGAVYGNGLQWVRAANVLLVIAIAVDVAKMASAAVAAGGLSAGAAAIAAAKSVDAINLRTPLQQTLRPLFGIDLPTGFYPLWIYRETRQAAERNHLATSFTKSAENVVPLPPILLFNLRTQGEQSLLPNMNLRFRDASDLLDDLGEVLESEPLYLSYDRAMTFTASQVQPCKNAHPGQMCVKTGTPKYGGSYCEVLPGTKTGMFKDQPFVKSMMDKAKWALKVLEPLLKDLKLDITHRTEPPDHTLLLYDFLSSRGEKYHQTSEVRVEGGGLAAWDLAAQPFRAKLISEEFDALPIIGPLLQKCPGGLSSGPWERALFTSGGSFAPSKP